MRTLGKTAGTIAVVGAIAASSAIPAAAQYYGRHHRYYNYYRGGAGWGTWNGCPPDWTIQGGVCKPYRHGPWDIYGGRQSDYGY